MSAEELTLSAVGLSEAEELVYRAMLQAADVSPAQLADLTGVPPAQVRGALEGLRQKGFASRETGRRAHWTPTAPDVAIESAFHTRREELERARSSASRLLEDFSARAKLRDPIEVVEVILGREALLQRFAQLQQLASRDFRAFDSPPYAQPPKPEDVGTPNVAEDAALKHGVRYRVIYSRAAIEYPGMLAHIARYVAAGEEARVVPEVPMKLDIADQAMAMLPLSMDESRVIEARLVIHQSPLLEALVAFFDMMWERAIPIAGIEALPGIDGSAEGSPHEEERLLTLLAAGLKDEAIARQLGIGLRTLHRRISELMRSLGAETRYQAGLQVARRGLYS
jgi:sugar-specific transcriptional regulator TrmB